MILQQFNKFNNIGVPWNAKILFIDTNIILVSHSLRRKQYFAEHIWIYAGRPNKQTAFSGQNKIKLRRKGEQNFNTIGFTV